jgi:hypothetical protein
LVRGIDKPRQIAVLTAELASRPVHARSCANALHATRQPRPRRDVPTGGEAPMTTTIALDPIESVG